MIDNRVTVVYNYATEALQETLDMYAKNNYKLVNSILAKNRYNVNVMYLFFTKETKSKNKVKIINKKRG